MCGYCLFFIDTQDGLRKISAYFIILQKAGPVNALLPDYAEAQLDKVFGQ